MKTFAAIFTFVASVVAVCGAGVVLAWWTENVWRGPPVSLVSAEIVTVNGRPALVRRVFTVHYAADCVSARWIQNGLAQALPGAAYSFAEGPDRLYYQTLSVADEIAPGQYTYVAELRCPVNPILTIEVPLPPLPFTVGGRP